MKDLSRRKFLQKSSLSAAALVTANTLKADVADMSNDRSHSVSIYGWFCRTQTSYCSYCHHWSGRPWTGHLKFAAGLPGTEIVAISDLYEDLVKKWAEEIRKIGKGQRHKNIATYYGDENRWRTMLTEVKPDMVFIATNWSNHAPMAIEAMNQGRMLLLKYPWP